MSEVRLPFSVFSAISAVNEKSAQGRLSMKRGGIFFLLNSGFFDADVVGCAKRIIRISQKDLCNTQD